MSFITGILTAVLVLTCIFLIFLILIQLPKKEAGMGVAFGAGATDALFGAGSGSNALTKMTRYSTIVFLVLSLFLAVLISHQARPSNPNFGSSVDAAARNAQQQMPPLPLKNTPQSEAVTPGSATSNATAVQTNAAQTNAGAVPLPVGTNQ
jgi:preprotein translocase subunit SecG